MHVLMGEMELADIHWDEDSRTLSFTAARPAGEQGSVFLWMPQGIHIENSGTVYVARNRDQSNGELVARVPLEFDGTPLKKTIHFTLDKSKAALADWPPIA